MSHFDLLRTDLQLSSFATLLGLSQFPVLLLVFRTGPPQPTAAHLHFEPLISIPDLLNRAALRPKESLFETSSESQDPYVFAAGGDPKNHLGNKFRERPMQSSWHRIH